MSPIERLRDRPGEGSHPDRLIFDAHRYVFLERTVSDCGDTQDRDDGGLRDLRAHVFPPRSGTGAGPKRSGGKTGGSGEGLLGDPSSNATGLQNPT